MNTIKRNAVLATVVLLCNLFAINAQVYIITPQQPINTFVGIEDLWNITVSAPPNGPLTAAQLTIELVDDNSIHVLTSRSALFNLPGGVSNFAKFSMGTLKPIENSIDGNPNYESVSKNGLLPAGNYHATYTLTGINTAGAPITSPTQEMAFSVEMLFPPTLLNPFNNDSIDTHNPVFAWAPAFTGNQRVTYDIVVAEQLPGQSPEQALNANPAYYKQENLLTTSITYPFAAQQLKANQWYAWRIIAKVGGIVASRTESWRFIITEPKDNPCIPKPVDFYFQLQQVTTGTYALVKNGQLNFYFNEKYNAQASSLNFKIYNTKNKVVASNKSIPRAYNTGFNYYTLMLTQNDASLPKGYYTLEVLGEKDQKWYLRFELVNDVTPCVNE